MFGHKKLKREITLSDIESVFIRYYERYKTVILVLLCIFVWAFSFPKVYQNHALWGLDESWIYFINSATGNNHVFGRDCYFTYGPMGFLLYPLNIDNNMIIYTLFTVIVGMYVLYALYHYIVKNRLSLYRVVIIVSLLFFFQIYEMQIYLIFVFVLSGMLICDDEKLYCNFFILCIYTAFMWLVKFSVALLGILYITVILFSILLKDRIANKSLKRTVVLSLLSVLIIPVFAVMYLSYNPSIPDMILYIKEGLQISSGYNYAMSTTYMDNNNSFYLIDVGVRCLLYTVSFLIVFFNNRNEVWKVVICAPFFLFSYKYGAVLCDSGHVDIGNQIMRLVGFVLVLTINVDNNIVHAVKKNKISLSALLIILVWWVLYDQLLLIKLILIFIGIILLNVDKQWIKLVRIGVFMWFVPFVFYNKGEELLAEANKLQYSIETGVKVVEDQHLPDNIKSKIMYEKTAFYPWDILRAECDDIDYICPPVIQGYAAYTPRLDELNANFFKSEEAPQYIVFERKSINDRYMPWEAPQTTMAIEKYYQVIETDQDSNPPLRLLEKRSEPLSDIKTVQSKIKLQIDNKIVVPETAESISVSIKPTIKHKLLNAVYRTDPVFCEIEFSDGTSGFYRVLLEQLVSELPIQCDIFDTGKRVKSISFDMDTLHYVDPELTLTIYNRT